ncbi:MAG: ChaN family lipoprotein [Phycisphaerales bacterium]
MFSGTGLEMTWSGLVARAAASDAVLIGELHGHPMGLDAAATLFDDLLELRPTTAALAMEFFETDEQIHIDDMMTGVIDHDGFMEATGAKACNGTRRATGGWSWPRWNGTARSLPRTRSALRPPRADRRVRAPGRPP